MTIGIYPQCVHIKMAPPAASVVEKGVQGCRSAKMTLWEETAKDPPVSKTQQMTLASITENVKNDRAVKNIRKRRVSVILARSKKHHKMTFGCEE